MEYDKQLQRLIKAVNLSDWPACDELIKRLQGRLAAQRKVSFLELAAHRYLATNSPQYAIPFLKELVQLDSRHSQARFNLGSALGELGDLQASKIYLEQAVNLNPEFADAWTNLGMVCKQTGEPLRALQCFKRAYELRAADPVSTLNLAIAMRDVGDQREALELLSRIDRPERMPDIASLEQFGLLLDSLNAHQRAALSFSLLHKMTREGRYLVSWLAAIARGKDTRSVEAVMNSNPWSALGPSDQLELAKVFCVEGFFEKSEMILRSLDAKKPRPAGYSFICGLLEHELGKFESARRFFTQSIEESESVESSLLMLGHLDRAQGDSAAAAARYREILRLNPQNSQAAYELALVILEKGPAEEAWKKYEERLHFFKRKHRFPVSGLLPPVTQAAEITENTVIWAEQGLGENLLFCQPLGDVCSRRALPYLIAPEKLHRFLDSANLNFSKPLLRETFYKNPEAYANEVSLCSLGGVLGIDFTKPIRLSGGTTGWPKIPGTPKVAVSWASYSSNFGGDKTPPVRWFAEMLSGIPNAVFTSVQYSLNLDDARFLSTALGDRFVCTEDPDFHNDLVRLKGTLSDCDLLLTVSNTTAHVAGVLDMPTILLVPKQKGRLWYWHHETDSVSHWYPSVRILAQEKDGDWSSLESAIQQAFQTLTGHIE